MLQKLPKRHVLAQNQQWNHPNNVWNVGWKLNTKNAERDADPRIFIANVEQISHAVMVFRSLTLDERMSDWV